MCLFKPLAEAWNRITLQTFAGEIAHVNIPQYFFPVHRQVQRSPRSDQNINETERNDTNDLGERFTGRNQVRLVISSLLTNKAQ
jgi:hypothetical protein